MGRALVRSLSSAYAQGATRAFYEPGSPIDAALAQRQHDAVVDGLVALGDEVHRLPSPPDLPDAVFVEDTAVVWGTDALLTRSAHPGRRGEARAVGEALEALGLRVTPMTSGTLDGGDVLRVGRRLFVGRSSRTDDEGIEALRRCFVGAEVVVVPLTDAALHLKCVASTPGDEATVVLAEGTIDPSVFAGCRVVTVPAAEAYAANVVGDGRRVLVAEGFPRTAERLVAAGFEPLPVDVSELRKGDGSLTCLSLRF
jgi:dimethylargininase